MGWHTYRHRILDKSEACSKRKDFSQVNNFNCDYKSNCCTFIHPRIVCYAQRLISLPHIHTVTHIHTWELLLCLFCGAINKRPMHIWHQQVVDISSLVASLLTHCKTFGI